MMCFLTMLSGIGLLLAEVHAKVLCPFTGWEHSAGSVCSAVPLWVRCSCPSTRGPLRPSADGTELPQDDSAIQSPGSRSRRRYEGEQTREVPPDHQGHVL